MHILHSAALLWMVIALSASGKARAQEATGPTTALSPELRTAFVAEMQRLDVGLQKVVSALARADWAGLEHQSHEIAGAFILEQRLSAKQREELHRALPPAFLALDAAFHARAGKLARAARDRDADLAAFHVYRLIDACASCHAQYAGHRFPDAAGPSSAGEHRH